MTETADKSYIIPVEQLKTALIVIDGTETIRKIAEVLSAALKGYQTRICPVESFAGTDLLAAHAIFIGCESPQPASFAYLDQMLAHINLSGRPGGIFSTDKKALKYLSTMIAASGINTGDPLLITDITTVTATVKKWTQTIPAGGF